VRPISYLVPLIVILLLSMMLHEIAHAFVAYKLGDPTAKSRGRLSLNPIRHLDPLGTLMFVFTYLAGGLLFGWAKPVPISPTYFKSRQKGMGLVGVAGPLTNFAIAAIFWAILMLFKRDFLAYSAGEVTVAIANILILALQVNVVLGVFNLIPIPPLDGSRVLGAFLPRDAYQWWANLDRYGWLLIVLILVLFGYTGSNILGNAYDALFRWLLPAYWG
jgi:Zn-dependent protease